MMRNGFVEIILRNVSKSSPVQVLITCHDAHVSWVYSESGCCVVIYFTPNNLFTDLINSIGLLDKYT